MKKTSASKKRLSIAMVVQGRLHGIAVARELVKLGHDVTLFTSYPKFLVRRFGFTTGNIVAFPLYFIIAKILSYVPWVKFRTWGDFALACLFGRWSAKVVPRERASWDVVIGFSGVVKELWERLEGTGTLRILERGSSHIRAQHDILEEEQKRVGGYINIPVEGIMQREETEYRLSERIRVLSKFAEKTFLQKGVPAKKVLTIPLGVDRSSFVATAASLGARKKRILAGEPLRVLYVGVFSYRKGAVDLEKIIEGSKGRFQFRFVGQVGEARDIVARLSNRAEFLGPRPESELPSIYAWADCFILPTIEDGFSLVLVQALASGIPVITTENCFGPELVDEGKSGWVVPIRRPDAFLQRLNWCDTHRQELARMLPHTQNEKKVQDWSTSVKKLEASILSARALTPKRKRSPKAAA